MRKLICLVWIVLPVLAFAEDHENRKLFFTSLAKLEFDVAREHARADTDSAMQSEMLQLADILFYEGQHDRTHFNVSDNIANQRRHELAWIRTLNAGYISLFYDRVKGDAYRYFYQAYQTARELNNPVLLKASLLAFFKYYNFEIVQVSDSYKAHVQHFDQLKSDYIDKVWISVYKMIFYSKPTASQTLDDQYFEQSKLLDSYEKRLNVKSPVLAHLYYEKAIRFEIQDKKDSARIYHQKVIAQARDYPFLKDKRLQSCLKLLAIEAGKKNFDKAGDYLAQARAEINAADTLRSNYLLNLYSAIYLYGARNQYDSAYILLKKAYLQEFEIDFRKNTVEINKLNIELETKEKENANLRLRQERTRLLYALGAIALLLGISYFAYMNQRSRNKIQQKEKEVQAMKLEKLLKDQELFGIDAMIEGQEKERQRIANDLHDNLGSLLATLKLHFQNLKIKKDRLEAEQNLLMQTTDELIEEAYQQVRSIAHAKNAGVNAQEGLLPAVKNFAAKVSIINKLVINVEEHGMDDRLENSMEITIFRIIQELIANIIKHAQATEATIHLTHHKDMINLMVEDNGIGFDIAQISPGEGMGLYSIQKRIENLGGKVTIDSIPARGTTIIIDVPIT